MVDEVSVVSKKIRLENTREKENKISFLKTSHQRLPHPILDDNAVKKILSSWKQLKIEKQREVGKIQQNHEIKKRRKEARLQLELMENTAGLEDNMEATKDFHNIIGCSQFYPSFIRAQCF
ncbi:hypothetical protein VNO77_42667 [Canavalia gladiata]|uniref:Uncharacterized protein n=1 Tax=Canavalia gladiata TaxID=3824 RepID=A0AAN9JSR0_CANGL